MGVGSKQRENEAKKQNAVSDLRRMLLLSAGPVLALSLISVTITMMGPFWPAAEKKDPIMTGTGKLEATVLTEKTFDSFLAENPQGVLVDFHRPDCKFCTRLTPQFELAAKRLREAENPARLAYVDGSSNPTLVDRLEIDRYPSVFWFWKGQKVQELDRASEKTASKIQELVIWAQETPFIDFSVRSTLEDAMPVFRQTMESTGTHMVGAIAKSTAAKEKMLELLEPAAQRYRGKVIIMTALDEPNETTEAPDLELPYTITAYAPEEESDEVFQGNETTEAATVWIKQIVDKTRLKILQAQVRAAEARKQELEAQIEAQKERAEEAEKAKIEEEEGEEVEV